jgi:hypothetical protein
VSPIVTGVGALAVGGDAQRALLPSHVASLRRLPAGISGLTRDRFGCSATVRAGG